MPKKLKKENFNWGKRESIFFDYKYSNSIHSRIISVAKIPKEMQEMRAILSRVFLRNRASSSVNRPNDCPPLVRVHDPFSFVVATIPTNHAVPSLHAPRMEKARKVFLSSFTAIRSPQFFVSWFYNITIWIIIFRLLSQISSLESFSSRRTFSLFRLRQDFQLICRVWKMEQRSELDFRIIILGEIKILLHFGTRSPITRFDERKNFHDII